ncbi:MAG: GGDEF domain-containing protein [Bacillota bacterium]|nr:GGDEF domain-containing protein [Bacillota bacterium]
MGFLFLLIGDTVYVFETTFNYYVWEMDHISAVVSVTLVSFAIFYTKTNKNTFDYSSLNLLSQENKMIFDYRIMILGIWLIYSFIYVLAVINNNISHKYFLQITIYGMIIFFIILLSNFSIIGYKEVRIIKLHKETIKDFLTGAFSKKHAVNALEYLFAYSKKQGFPISVLMLDIDHFKEYNDTWGHPEGDKILKDIVRIIINEVGEHNMVSRYGGEEFLILLPNVSRNQGIKICERIREKVEQKEFKGEETQPLGKITVSIGGYNICANTKDKNELITKADKALYQAKISRNTCIWYGDS